MKRFDFASDVAKQLITICSAIIAIVIAFYEKFFSHAPWTFYAVLLLLFVFVLSILCGIGGIGGLTELVEDQEHNDWKEKKQAAEEQARIAEPQPAAPPPVADAPERAAGHERQVEAGVAPAPTNAADEDEGFVSLHNTWAETLTRLQQVIFVGGLVVFLVIAFFDHWLAPSPSPESTKAAMAAPVADAERPIVWAQAHPDRDDREGWLIGRAVVGHGAECPDAVIDGERVAMTARSRRSDPDFPRTICEVAYDGTKSATIAGVKLAARPQDPDRILVVGDTGCRITHYTAQECNRDQEWPFRMVADAAARLKPQLIIHVGDYHYREKACADRAGCSGSPWGDNWATWNAEFFEPARALLAPAPWIMLRGNHENCGRSGAGWLLLLWQELRDKLAAQCEDDTEPYLLHFKDLTFAVFDTAAAEDEFGRNNRLKKFQNQIRGIAAKLPRKAERSDSTAWLFLHQPPWVSFGTCKDPEPLACSESDFFRGIEHQIEGAANITPEQKKQLREQQESPLDSFRKWFEGTVAATAPPDGQPPAPAEQTERLPSPPISVVFSGDTHMFQMFAPDRSKSADFPIQVIGGMGGDNLESEKSFSKLLARPGGTSARLFGVEGKLWARREFGFLLLTKDSAGWKATFHDVHGTARLTCNLVNGECKAA